jgi:hypothetical protein
MMILFLNVNTSMIELYGEKGVIRIPFKYAGQLHAHIGNNSSVLYITNAVQTVPVEVINMIKNMGVVIEDAPIPVQEKKTYIHVAGEEIIPIDDLLRFRGHYDAHPLTPALIQKIKQTPLLQALIKNKKLELITSSKRKELEEERVRKEDERIGSILVDREELENQSEHGDAEVIDFSSEVSGARPRVGTGESGAATMSELSELLDG